MSGHIPIHLIVVSAIKVFKEVEEINFNKMPIYKPWQMDFSQIKESLLVNSNAKCQTCDALSNSPMKFKKALKLAILSCPSP